MKKPEKPTEAPALGPVSDEEFILAWQAAGTLAQAAFAARMTPVRAKQRACYMRTKKLIDLKKFQRETMDVEKLRELARKAARK